jgi:hypothetical protein
MKRIQYNTKNGWVGSTATLTSMGSKHVKVLHQETLEELRKI